MFIYLFLLKLILEWPKSVEFSTYEGGRGCKNFDSWGRKIGLVREELSKI